ncbi:MAG: hypothetical protein FJ100_00620 [Deltaproteobacteria bacterium]|nr:hypothetical protein [Deltaproteobacteria bacterium]
MATPQAEPQTDPPGMAQAELTAAEHRLRETADAIVRLIAEHVPAYVEAEIRRRFVAAESADLIADDELRQLRSAATQQGKVAAARVERELAWPGPWLLSVAQMPAPKDSKPTLREFPLVWSVVAALDAEVEALAARHHLPADDRQPAGYQPPRLFVSGAFLPQLTERLVASFHEIATLRAKLDSAQAADRKAARERRWQNAG